MIYILFTSALLYCSIGPAVSRRSLIPAPVIWDEFYTDLVPAAGGHYHQEAGHQGGGHGKSSGDGRYDHWGGHGQEDHGHHKKKEWDGGDFRAHQSGHGNNNQAKATNYWDNNRDGKNKRWKKVYHQESHGGDDGNHDKAKRAGYNGAYNGWKKYADKDGDEKNRGWEESRNHQNSDHGEYNNKWGDDRYGHHHGRHSGLGGGHRDASDRHGNDHYRGYRDYHRGSGNNDYRGANQGQPYY